MRPAFHRQRISAFGSVITDATEELLASWERRLSSQPINLAPKMRHLVMRIVARTLLGAELGSGLASLARSFGLTLDWVNRRLVNPLDPTARLPLPVRRRFQQALAQLETIVRGFIEQRRRSGESGDDLLGLLLSLRDEVITLFLAGVETPANGLLWTFCTPAC